MYLSYILKPGISEPWWKYDFACILLTSTGISLKTVTTLKSVVGTLISLTSAYVRSYSARCPYNLPHLSSLSGHVLLSLFLTSTMSLLQGALSYC